MQRITCADAPIRVYGLLQESLPECFHRLPQQLALPQELLSRARTPAGGRVRFRTDAPQVTAHMELDTLTVDFAIPLCGSAGAVAAVGTGAGMRYAGLLCPRKYDERSVSLTFAKDPVMEDVTLFLPRNEAVRSVWFTLPDGAKVEPPTPYAVEKPIVFYGSSITEGGCASRVTNAYPALLSKWLNADFINLGFSGLAKGELPVARFIAGHAMSAFVYDYDHNAPSPAHLAATHEPFFRVIRDAHPTLPILILTKPDSDANPADAAARREVIRGTFLRAQAAGDRHVAFLDGHAFFGASDRADCAVDNCHPNDLGFMRMAETVYPVLKEMLG